MTRRILSVLVAALMLIALIPMSALAANTKTAALRNKTETKNEQAANDASAKHFEPLSEGLDNALNVEGGELTFETSEDHPWYPVVNYQLDRVYAMSGNAGVHNSSSAIWTTVEVGYGDTLSFDFKAWGKTWFDSIYNECNFLVDDALIFRYGGYDNDWETYTYSFVEPGTHTIKWEYHKDDSQDPTGDYFAVDNVSLNEVVIPESISVDTVEVGVGESVQAVFTVVPNNASILVSYSVENENIAEVDETGRVFGRSPGTTFLTVTSNVDGSVYGTAPITVTENQHEPEFYGFVYYDECSQHSKQLIKFSYSDPSAVTAVHSEILTYAAAFYDGRIYSYYVDSDFFVLDAYTFETVMTGARAPYTAIAMAYNYTNDTMYALMFDTGGSGRSFIGTVDLETGEAEVIANVTGMGRCLTFAIDNEGNAYSVEMDDNACLYRIDLETGAATLIGETGTGCYYSQSMTWDMNTNRLFWAQQDGAGSKLYEIDPATGAAEPIGPICCGYVELCGLYTMYYHNPEPEVIESVDVIGFEVPGYGEEPFRGVTVPEDAHYSIVFNDWYWYTDDEEGQMGEGELFDNEDYLYYQYFRLIPDRGYTFSEDTVVTIDGSGEYVEYYDFDPDTGRLNVDTTDFTVKGGSGQDYIVVSEITVNGYKYPPYAGHDSIDWLDLSVPEDAAYYVDFESTTWYDEDAMMAFSGTFESGTEYSVATVVQLPEGCVFGEEVTILLNGNTEILSDHVYVYEDHILFYTIPFLCRMWGDADGDGELTTVDAVLIMRYALGIGEIDEDDLDPWCDVNGDGAWDFTDALLILRKTLGVIDLFPTER